MAVTSIDCEAAGVRSIRTLQEAVRQRAASQTT
jgi:hypothetical protein